MSQEYIRYKRSRFRDRLLRNRLYTASHFWIEDCGSDEYKVGFTRFARRMLGEAVEIDFEIHANSPVELGETIGWAEAFKAVTDLYSVGNGTFITGNPALADNPHLVDLDPDGEGWLYRFRGEPDPESGPAEQYVEVLDRQIDKIMGKPDTSSDVGS